jgi:hypothetical protein
MPVCLCWYFDRVCSLSVSSAGARGGVGDPQSLLEPHAPPSQNTKPVEPVPDIGRAPGAAHEAADGYVGLGPGISGLGLRVYG